MRNFLDFMINTKNLQGRRMLHNFYNSFYFIVFIDVLFCSVIVLKTFCCLDRLGIKYEKKTKGIILWYAILLTIIIQCFWFLHSFYFWRDFQ